MIISASRRCDIPAFYGEWMENRIREGYVLVANPRNTKQMKRVDLRPETVDAIVFWTKNPTPMLPRLDVFSDFSYEFQVTLTPYGVDIEPGLPSKERMLIPSLLRLSERIGSDRVIWRYDPILLNEKYTEDYHEEAFGRLALILRNATKRVTISFIDTQYRSVSRNLNTLGLIEINDATRLRLAGKLARIAFENHLIIEACAESSDLTAVGIRPAHCISAERIGGLVGHPLTVTRAKGQRPACGCWDSVDIGAYNMCTNGCRYCYANYAPSVINANVQKHEPSSPIIIGTI